MHCGVMMSDDLDGTCDIYLLSSLYQSYSILNLYSVRLLHPIQRSSISCRWLARCFGARESTAFRKQ